LYRKIISIVLICTLLFTYIPFGNFKVNAEDLENKGQVKKEERLELIEERTAVSKTFDNLDGTYSTEITQSPQHFQDKEGNWKEIKNELVPGEKGKYQNKENSFVVEFDKKSTDQSKGVQISEGDYKVDLNLVEMETTKKETTEPSEGIVEDNQITYKEIFNGVSAVYTVGENYVKEDIVLHAIPENGIPEKFTYQLDLQGLAYEEIGDNIYLQDAGTGENLYIIDAPYMYDSYMPEDFASVKEIKSIPEEAKSYDIQIDTREENGQLFIDLIPDSNWINDGSRVYPIVIDPMIVRVQGAVDTVDTTLRSSFPTRTGGNDFELGIGASTDGNIVRSLLKFDLSSIPFVGNVLSADLNLYLSSTNSSNPINISAHAVTGAWEENEASWTYKDTTPYTKWAMAGGDYGTNALSTVSGIAAAPANLADGLTRWSIPVNTVQQWVSNPTSNYGFLLKSTSESTKVYKKFASSEQSVITEYKPKLVVTYKTPSRLGLESYWDYATHPLVGGANYVNLGTNNNIVQYQDFSILNYADFGLDFVRTYNSKDYEKSAFGYGWTYTGDQKLFIGTGASKSNIEYKDEDGTIHVYTYDANTKKYISPAGVYETLTKVNESTYTLTAVEGGVTTFTVRENAADTTMKVAYIARQTDLNGNTITYNYNSQQKLESIRTSLGTAITFAYNAKGLISNVKYNGQQINYTYTSGDYLEKVFVNRSTSESPTAKFAYTSGYLTTITDAKGHVTTFAYDSADLISVTEPALNGEKPSITNYSLDRTNNLVTVTSPEGDVTRYLLNNNFVVEKIVQPSGEETSYTLDRNYNITTEKTIYTDGTTYTKTNKYTEQGNLKESTDSNGSVYAYTYDMYGNVVTEKDASGNVTTYQYDTRGLLKWMKSAKGEITVYEYDSRGDLTRIVYPTGNSETFSTSYENNRKKTTHTDTALNITTETVADFNGNILSSKDGKGQTTNFAYNINNELTTVTDASGKITSYGYDGNGNLENVVNANGHRMKWLYNAQNAITDEINALGKVTSYRYNADGELSEVAKASGDKITYDTDSAAGTQIVKVNGLTQFTTKNDGLQTMVTNHSLANQTMTYTQTENGLLNRVDFSGSNNSLTYAYKGEETLESLTFGTQKLEFLSNANLQTETIKLNGSKLADFTYKANGNDEKTIFTNGITSIANSYVGNDT
jgi:YD repeat-containing protein